MNKIMIGSCIVLMLAVGGIFRLLNDTTSQTKSSDSEVTNVSIVDDKQVIRISAKGGYAPRNTVAKANMPTVIDVTTNGTYDCTSALSIPAIGFRKSLPASGTTHIDIPPQQPGAVVTGICTLGMYNFSVNFIP